MAQGLYRADSGYDSYEYRFGNSSPDPETPAPETPDPEATDTAKPTPPEEPAPADTQAPDTGCTATLPAVFFVSLALSPAALLPRRHRRPRRA